MSNRRQFLSTLGKALGAGGLLLPLQGKGALAFPTDLGEAAALRLSASPMPWSPERLELQRLKQAMLEHRVASMTGRGGTHAQMEQSWRLLMHDYRQVADTVAARPRPTWRDATELAEIMWHMEEKELSRGPYEGVFTGRLSTYVEGFRDPRDHWRRRVHVALIEAVLTLGGGERFDPREGCHE